MKTIDELNYNLVNLKCALVDVEVKHGAHKRSTTGEVITKLSNKIINLVYRAEALVNEIEEAGSTAFTALTMECDAGYLLDISNRCRFVYTARQRKRIVEALELIYTALTNQVSKAEELFRTAPAIEVTEIIEVTETASEAVSEVIEVTSEITELDKINENVIIYNLLSIYFTYYLNRKVSYKWLEPSMMRKPSALQQLIIIMMNLNQIRVATILILCLRLLERRTLKTSPQPLEYSEAS